MSSFSAHARDQYTAGSGNLTARMALHRFGTNPVSWFEWLEPRLPRAGRVLEVGAGTGELWRHLSHGPLTLADFSPAMCAELTTIPQARVTRADAAALPFGAGAFDTVIANHMLYHLDDPAAALREFARVLAPGGRVAIALNGPGHMAELHQITDYTTRVNGVDAETAPALLATVFDDVRLERYPTSLEVPAAEPVLAYLDSWKSLTPDARASAEAEVRARIAADGTFRVTQHTVLCTASRR